jgi:hypothetical protein
MDPDTGSKLQKRSLLTELKTSVEICVSRHSYKLTDTAVNRNVHFRNTKRIFLPCLLPEVEVKLRPTVSQSVCQFVCQSVCKSVCQSVLVSGSGAHDQIFVFCSTIAGFLMWGALFDERMGL